MSTEYMPSKRIAFERIKNFNHNGVTAVMNDGDVLLTDGINYLWAWPSCPGRRVTFIRQGGNDVDLIIKTLEDYFHVRLITEHEDEFFDIIKTERKLHRKLIKKRRFKADMKKEVKKTTLKWTAKDKKALHDAINAPKDVRRKRKGYAHKTNHSHVLPCCPQPSPLKQRDENIKYLSISPPSGEPTKELIEFVTRIVNEQRAKDLAKALKKKSKGKKV